MSFLFNNFYNYISKIDIVFFCEHAVKHQLGFQDSASSTFDDISMFNDTVFLIILVISIFVFYIFFQLII